jgi:hypothetical protein
LVAVVVGNLLLAVEQIIIHFTMVWVGKLSQLALPQLQVLQSLMQ